MKLKPLFRPELTAATWAVFDQAVVSLATFSLNLALARFATPEVYGQFVIAFSLLLLAYACVQVPLALEPLIFLGGKKTNTQDQAIYVRHSFVLTVAVGLVCVGLLLTIGVCDLPGDFRTS